MTTECAIENLLDTLKADGAFDCEHGRTSVKDYFKGQCDAIISITAQIHRLLEGIDKAKSEFSEILKYADSFNDSQNPSCEHEVH